MDILKTTQLTKIYGSGDTAVHALENVNLTVEKGGFVAVVSTSGSGKSTLLHMIGGLDVPTSGKIFVDGQELGAMTDEQLTIFRRCNIGFVFQMYNLIPMLNVWKNIMLAAKPALLLADEPTGNLDSRTSQDVLGLLKITGEEFFQTIIMITHNEEIAQLADRILRIEDGHLTSGSSPRPDLTPVSRTALTGGYAHGKSRKPQNLMVSHKTISENKPSAEFHRHPGNYFNFHAFYHALYRCRLPVSLAA